MSHFAIIVVGQNIDEQLEPYAEQDADTQYLQFEDVEDDCFDEYTNKEVELVKLADGSIYLKYAHQFQVHNPKTFKSDYVYPEGSQIINGHYNLLYPTFDDFMCDYHGHEGRDEEKNRYGYWNNPNAKWDWYVVGGRWSGYFKPVSGASGFLGRPGAFNNVPEEGWVDSLRIQDIDIAGMKALSVQRANETYDLLEGALQGRELPSWNKTREKHGDNIEAARTEYHANPVVKDIQKAGLDSWDDLVEVYGPDRNAYIQRQADGTMVPFAFVVDGKWYQRGEMGWFGCSTDEMSVDEWHRQFWEMIASLPEDTLLTAVDCHI